MNNFFLIDSLLIFLENKCLGFFLKIEQRDLFLFENFIF